MTAATHLAERFDPDEIAPGVYTADSDSDAWGLLKALVAIGDAKEIGEHYLQDGKMSVAVEVLPAGARSAAHNPEIAMSSGDGGDFVGAVGIGADYYVSALREYDPWKWMWWREALQNSIDAGATRVDLTVEDRGDGTVLVACDDDGRGMDKDTLLNKFLMLGGSGKKGEASATGGFGKAKELLILPWLSWEIASRDVVVSGKNSAYSGKTVKERVGTRLSVVMRSDDATDAVSAKAVLMRSTIPDVRFRVNGERVRADLEHGDELAAFADDDEIRLYHKKARRVRDESGELDYREGQRGLFVRKNGLYMFQMSIPEGVPGYIVCEVLGSSLAMFTTNRMMFRSWGVRTRVEQYVLSLAKDVRSGLAKKKKQFHKVWEGEAVRGGVAEGDLKAIMLANIGAADRIDERDKVKELTEVYRKAVEEEQKAEAEAQAEAEVADEDKESGGDEKVTEAGPAPKAPPPTGRPEPDIVQFILEVAGTGAKAVEAAVAQIAGQPRFYVHGEDWVPPKRMTPDGEPMMPTLRKVSKFWTAICQLIMTRLGSPRAFGVGWIFEQDTTGDGYTKGETVTHEGKAYLLLNPFREGFIEKGDYYSLRNEDDLDIIWSIAVHECVHLASGIGGHDESFSSALTNAFAKTSRAHQYLKRIRDLVVRRTDAEKAYMEALRAKKKERKATRSLKFTPEMERKIKGAKKALVSERSSYHGIDFYRPGEEYGHIYYTMRLRHGASTAVDNLEFKLENEDNGTLATGDGYPTREAAWEGLEAALRAEVVKQFPNAVQYDLRQARAVKLDKQAEEALDFLKNGLAETTGDDSLNYGRRVNVTVQRPGWSSRTPPEVRYTVYVNADYQGNGVYEYSVSVDSRLGGTIEEKKKVKRADLVETALDLFRKVIVNQRAIDGYDVDNLATGDPFAVAARKKTEGEA